VGFQANIESIFANLKREMRLENHLAKTLPAGSPNASLSACSHSRSRS
jgi:hypothetical protein